MGEQAKVEGTIVVGDGDEQYELTPREQSMVARILSIEKESIKSYDEAKTIYSVVGSRVATTAQK